MTKTLHSIRSKKEEKKSPERGEIRTHNLIIFALRFTAQPHKSCLMEIYFWSHTFCFLIFASENISKTHSFFPFNYFSECHETDLSNWNS